MNVTGFQIKEAIKEVQREREILNTQVATALFKFEGEDKPSLDDVAKKLYMCETRIAQLQTLQTKFNLNVEVKVRGKTVPLLEAVKRVGSADRLENVWRDAAKNHGSVGFSARRGYTSTVRNKDEIHAERTVSVEDCMAKAKSSAKFAAELRNAIQLGNSSELELNSSEQSLFE